jgi:hypothetical protein
MKSLALIQLVAKHGAPDVLGTHVQRDCDHLQVERELAFVEGQQGPSLVVESLAEEVRLEEDLAFVEHRGEALPRNEPRETVRTAA